MRAAVVGAAGYVGGELLRLLLGHPVLELVQATSAALLGRAVHDAHPNLRGHTELRFSSPDRLTPCDVLFLATPAGVARTNLAAFAAAAPVIVDLSPDFRPGRPAPGPDRDAEDNGAGQQSFVPGIPEVFRAELGASTRISVPGCMANAAILALRPLRRAGLVGPDVHVDARTGSSGSGRRPTPAGTHAERSGVLRVYQTFQHRHAAEIGAVCDVRATMGVTAIEAVRGVQVLVHATATRALASRELWQCYRAAYEKEPFVTVVAGHRGWHRLPDPKILAGTNRCEVGFGVGPEGSRLILVAALDNLVKGGAGTAVQCANLAAGLDETAGLGAIGLHPV